MLESLKKKQPQEIIELSTSGQQLIVIVILEGLRIEALIDFGVHINAIDNILVQI